VAEVVSGVGEAIAGRIPRALLLACSLLVAPVPRAYAAVRFVSPPNGSSGLARFLPVTADFDAPLPADPAALAERIALRDRRGRTVPLALRRSETRATLLLAFPGGEDGRLLPGEDYFLEVRDPSEPDSVVRARFQTGGARSALCVAPDGGGGWRDGCEERSSWRIALGLPRCLPEPGGSSECRCSAEGADVPGGWRARCRCYEEERVLGQTAGFAFPAAFEPAAGSNAPGAERVALEVDRDLPEGDGRYRMEIEDVTDRAVAPRRVARGRPAYGARRFELAAGLEPDRRYRVSLAREDAPSPGAPYLIGPEPHRVRWTFTTHREGAQARPLAMLPAPRTPRVPFPTHLPLRPHLRVVFGSPPPGGLADLDPAPVEIVGPDGSVRSQVVSWMDDADATRLHVLAVDALDPGQRYELRCTPGFAAAIGVPACASEPLGRFLTQPPLPDSIVRDVHHGARSDLEPAGERWLALRPTVLDDEHGLKERYEADAEGPLRWLGHRMLVPAADGSFSASFRVDPAPGCATLDAPILDACPGEPLYLVEHGCETDAHCPAGAVCAACPAPGNAGCPGGSMRCLVDQGAVSRRLTAFCASIGSGEKAACRLEDALRCAAAGAMGCAAAAKTLLGADSPAECPRGYQLDPGAGCVPVGPIEIELAPGPHALAPVDLTARYAHHLRDGQLEGGAPRVRLIGAQGEPSVLSALEPLPPAGVAFESGRCLTSGTGETYRCEGPGATCGPSTGFRCLPAWRGATTLASCPAGAGFRLEAGICSADPLHAAFVCEADGCTSRWLRVDEAANLWRIWWPERAPPLAGHSAGAYLRSRMPDGSVREIPVLRAGPDWERCASRADLGACMRELCERWRGATASEQRALALERLRRDGRKEPLALLWSGHLARPGGGSACRGSLDETRRVEYLEPSGPAALFVRLPAGETPYDRGLEASLSRAPLRLTGFGELELYGLAVEGAAAPLSLEARAVRLHGVQWTGRAPAAIHALRVTDLEIADGFVHGAGLATVQHSGRALVTNNVVLQARGKIYTTEADTAERAAPGLCQDGPGCVRARCRRDADCRIPFASADAGIGEPPDPAQDGSFARCAAVDPRSGIGRCAPGMLDLRLIADNVLLDGAGFEGAPFLRTRIQRNHFERRTAQEMIDATYGAAWFWLLDNADWDAASGTRPVVVQPIPGDPSGREPFLRAISIEGNLIARRAPGSAVAGRMPVFPGAQSQRLITVAPGPEAARLDGGGVRVAQNRLLDKPGARAWSTADVGGIEVDVPALLVERNVVVTDAPAGIAARGAPAAPTPSGSIEHNLVLSAGPSVASDPGCDARDASDIRVLGRANVELCDNASPHGVRGALALRCAHQELGSGARSRALGEPLAEPVDLDAETFARRVFTSADAERAALAEWPAYDPALLGDALEPHPGVIACAIGPTPRPCPPRPWWNELLDVLTGRLRR
jgi:hypothetical protein